MGFVGSQLYFPEKYVFCLFYFHNVLQNLLIAEVAGEVLELAVEERIQPDGCHALVPPENKAWSRFISKHFYILPYDLGSIVLKRLMDIHHSFKMYITSLPIISIYHGILSYSFYVQLPNRKEISVSNN